MQKQSVKPFGRYVKNIENLVESLFKNPDTERKSHFVKEALNGQPASEIRYAIPLSDRRAGGIFFTGPKLARMVSSQLISHIRPNTVIADIGCGAGDLTLACANKLPIGSDLEETLKIWSDHLMGFDIYPEFIDTSKIRLILLAISRGVKIQNSSMPNMKDVFPSILKRDFLSCSDEITKASHVIINPPYSEFIASPECPWGTGKVSSAALFMDKCVSNASIGTKIVAILPDVLRSGSYYEKWRQHIESMSEELQITIYGQFDKRTDVDVFILKLVRSNYKKRVRTMWWKPIKEAHRGKVGDYFRVHVGPVVPHRHPEKGPCVAYLHAKKLPPWKTVKQMNEYRKFTGTLFEPPFVAVRRTSRPGDKRAIATILIGKHKIAVENHLIALFPNRKTITECEELLRVLKCPQTDRWLDKRIRCRHLTVGALEDLPWWRG
jgi:hypothetical protein